ncbi:MAG: alpha/beta hydrolase [Frankia sp.]|nr:alpha/beta hydrolase [Frankia sp.]
MRPAFLLVHGAATTGAIWAGVRRALPGEVVLAPDRPSTGDLTRELAAVRAWLAQAAGAAGADGTGPGPARVAAGELEPLPAGPVVYGGVSGGATLGLAALAAGMPLAGAVLHEPAVGRLLPGLLAPVAAAFAAGGVAAFGRTLYGSRWQVSHAPADHGAVERDLAMFQRFEPAAIPPGAGPVVVTVGEHSPPVRHQAAEALRRGLGLPVRVLPGCGHAAHLEAPEEFARRLLAVAEEVAGTAGASSGGAGRSERPGQRSR